MPIPPLTQTVNEIYKAIERAFEAHWAAATAIVYDNKTTDVEQFDEFVRLSIQPIPGLSDRAGFGPDTSILIRREALVFASVYTKHGTARNRSNELVELALRFFEELPPPAGVWFRNAGPGATIVESGWFGENVSANMVYDVLRTP